MENRSPRLAPSLSTFAAREITELAEALGMTPSALAARGLEGWVMSDEFLKMKARAIQAMQQTQEPAK